LRPGRENVLPTAPVLLPFLTFNSQLSLSMGFKENPSYFYWDFVKPYSFIEHPLLKNKEWMCFREACPLPLEMKKWTFP
jgi:hypothetical protein